MKNSPKLKKIPLREREREREYLTFKNLLKAYYQCRKSKRHSASATEFEPDFERKLIRMETGLKNRDYRIGRYTCFAITDPKIREVWAADFRDRITHHLLVNYLEPIWEKKFIFHSYACRQEKGAHLAVRSLKKVLRSQKQKLFFLQVDIESFFMSIDKEILYHLIEKRVKSAEILWLAKMIIFHDPLSAYQIKGDLKTLGAVPGNKSFFHIPPGKGLPIGNYTSQFFANVYMDEIDQFIKHRLRCRHYFRYMDDLLLLHPSKEQLLSWRGSISDFLHQKLLLKLHPKKQTLQPVDRGIDFLGYIVKPDHALSRKRSVANLKRKLHAFNLRIDPNTKPVPEKNRSFQLSLFPKIINRTGKDEAGLMELIIKAQATINSYYGHFKHADCFRLREKLYFSHFKELKYHLEPANPRRYDHFVRTAKSNPEK